MSILGMTGKEAMGAGSILGALATIYGIHEQKEHNEEMLNFEKDRVAKEREKDANRQAQYEAVWATESTQTS